jgi:hypothetical protein
MTYKTTEYESKVHTAYIYEEDVFGVMFIITSDNDFLIYSPNYPLINRKNIKHNIKVYIKIYDEKHCLLKHYETYSRVNNKLNILFINEYKKDIFDALNSKKYIRISVKWIDLIINNFNIPCGRCIKNKSVYGIKHKINL